MIAPAALPKVLIRDLVSIEDLRQLQRVEKEVWEMGDEDSLPMTLAIALQAAGSIFVGAFDRDRLVGFAFGIFGREHGQTTIHSHMLAVLDPYRLHDLGLKLKMAQRERALALGVREMTWTYDPLQSRNAHLNFAKLGVSLRILQGQFLRAGDVQRSASQRYRPAVGALAAGFAARAGSGGGEGFTGGNAGCAAASGSSGEL